MTEITAVMVLAAGRGERMRPLSDVLPKPALPLADGPVIASALRLAAHTALGRIVVNTWHLGDRMKTAIAEVVSPGMTVILSPETSLMGTAGGLAHARDHGLLGTTGSVLVINGDGLFELDLGPLFEHHAAGSDAVTLALLPHPDPKRWSRVLVDSKGRVTAIRPSGKVEPGELPLLYPGVMAVTREALNGLPSTPGETPDRLWFPALAGKKLGGAEISGNWSEIGTPDDYRSVITEQLVGRSVIHPTATVAPTALIDDSLIGRDASIGDHAVIRCSVVGEGATVDAHGSVTHSVLLGAARAGTGEVVDQEVRTGTMESA